MTWISLICFAVAICTTLAFTPQAIKTIKTKNTKDILLPLYVIINLGIILWLTYGIVNAKAPIIAANGITFVFLL